MRGPIGVSPLPLSNVQEPDESVAEAHGFAGGVKQERRGSAADGFEPTGSRPQDFLPSGFGQRRFARNGVESKGSARTGVDPTEVDQTGPAFMREADDSHGIQDQRMIDPYLPGGFPVDEAERDGAERLD